VGSKVTESDAFLKAIKSVALLRSEEQQTRRSYEVRFYCKLKNTAEYERDISSKKLIAIPPNFLLFRH
jgi:hypothetical protein